MSQLDAGDRDGRVRERLEPGHRRAASLDRAMVVSNDTISENVGIDMNGLLRFM